MQSYWIQRQHHRQLLLFFAGWGSDFRPFLPIPAQEMDVLMLYDYRDMTLPDELEAMFAGYQTVNVLAWSLGVWVANKVLSPLQLSINEAIAINGTLSPIDNQLGIPTDVFEGTLQNMSPINMVKFNRRMFGNNSHQAQFQQHAPQREVNELKTELALLQQLTHPSNNKIFTKALISSDDRIFPTAHQYQFWEELVTTHEAPAGHFPFYGYENWDAILQTPQQQHV
jgi:biotin synthesis protein BioG